MLYHGTHAERNAAKSAYTARYGRIAAAPACRGTSAPHKFLRESTTFRRGRAAVSWRLAATAFCRCAAFRTTSDTDPAAKRANRSLGLR